MRHPESDVSNAKVQLIRLTKLTSAGWAALLCSCAALTPGLDLPDRSLPLDWSARAATLASWQQYSLRGRISVTRGDEVLTARLSWWQRASRSELRISSPLGVGGVDLVVDGALEQNLSEALGVDVPLKSLKYWLLGIPDPDLPIEALVFGHGEVTEMAREAVPQDLPRRFQQAGWLIQYRRYALVPDTRLILPSRVDLQRDLLEVRVFVEAWGSET